MQTLIKAAEHITNVNARGCFSVFCLFAPRARTRTRTCALNFFTSLASCSVTVLYRSYVEGTASRNLEVMGAGSLRGEAMEGGGIPKGTGAIGKRTQRIELGGTRYGKREVESPSVSPY